MMSSDLERHFAATIDEDQQDVLFDEPASGDFFGFASLLDQLPHLRCRR